MTIITIDSIALVDKLAPLFRIVLSIAFGFVVFIILKLFATICEDNKKRKKREEAKQLYTARKRQFENNPKGWKKWRDANYKITDLIEGDYYY